MKLSRLEVAEKAGVDVAYIDRLVDADILRPDAAGGCSLADVRRARLVRSLELAGVSLDGMAVAVREGTLSFSYLDAGAFDEPFAALSGTTFREVSETTGVPLELLSVVREDELDVVPAIELQLANGFRPAAIERMLRVSGDSLRRIAETESDFWSTEVMRALLDSGMAESDMLDTQADLGTTMVPLMERALLGIYHGQQQHAWSQSSVEMVERALERAGVPSERHGPPATSRASRGSRRSEETRRLRTSRRAWRLSCAGRPRRTEGIR